MAYPKAAVISGDIVGSSYLKPSSRRKLQNLLEVFIDEYSQVYPDLQVQQYRGDSIQGILTTNRTSALRIALLLHSYLLQHSFKMRLAIGVGEISYKSKQVITSDGSAFQASGPFLDALAKSGEIISVASAADEFTGEWQVHSSTLDYFIQRWSIQQAEAVYLQLRELTQEAIAQKLNIKQPSVYYRLQAAGWHVVHKILTRFESVIPTV